MTDLLYDDIQDQLRAAVRSLLQDRAPWPAVLARTETAEPTDSALWATLAGELGGAGLAVPERLGGAGASWKESAVVLEELGRSLAPVPFLGSAVAATAALLCAGEGELLPRLATGQETAALAVPFAAPPAPNPRNSVTEANGRLTGTVTGVADVLIADTLLVPADTGLFAVDATNAGRTLVTSLDMTRPLCDVSLSGAPARKIADGSDAGQAMAAGLRSAAGLLASEQLGLAELCLEMAMDHVGSRYQFARPIGSYQGIKHRIADLWVEITQARSVARYAAACLAGDDEDAAVAVSLAQAYCSEVAVKAAEECVQFHGGIGLTWEHPAHLYLKRAKADSIAFGTADRHRALLAGLIDLPA